MKTANSLVTPFACIGLLCSSCATLFQGTHEEIMIASDPSGAHVTVNDEEHSGMTPISFRTNRSDDLQIHISKEGYQSHDVSDSSHISWGYFVADFFLTGLIGLGIDGLDGALFHHNQEMVTAHLEPIAEHAGLAMPTTQIPAMPAAPARDVAPVPAIQN